MTTRIERDPVGPGQESVWDYPRPPRLEAVSERIEVVLGGQTVATADTGYRVLETSHPPTYYLPRAAFLDGSLDEAIGSSFCEWKGLASYLDIVGGGMIARAAAWYYPEPTAPFRDLLGHLALYPGRMDRVTVGGEVVRAQPGGFYGGWITDRVAGPFKGAPGTMFW